MRSPRRWLPLACAALALVVAGAPAVAQEAPALAADPALEQQTMDIARELRCLVCQNQTIAESNADLAVDLREQIREQLEAGRSAGQIRDYMVARYGEFVLYRPRFGLRTLLLWVGPFVLLLLAFYVLWSTVRGRRTLAPPPALAPEEQQRARELLGLGEDQRQP